MFLTKREEVQYSYYIVENKCKVSLQPTRVNHKSQALLLQSGRLQWNIPLDLGGKVWQLFLDKQVAAAPQKAETTLKKHKEMVRAQC